MDYPFALEAFGIKDGYAYGDHEIRGYVDPNDLIDEAYENNNFNVKRLTTP